MFDGYNRTFKHASKECDCEMTFAVYYPPQAESRKVPVRYLHALLHCGPLCCSSVLICIMTKAMALKVPMSTGAQSSHCS